MKRIRGAGIGLLAAAGCGGGSPSGPPPPPPPPSFPSTLTIVTRPSPADTVSARPSQGIVVEARDAAGRPTAGIGLQVIGLAGPGGVPATMLVRVPGNSVYRELESITTDAAGQATVLVQFGTVAGAGGVQIAAAGVSLAVTVDFTITPGNVVPFALTPRDTLMHPGKSVQFAAPLKDRFGNARSDPVTWTVAATPATAAINASTGLVTATAPCRATITASVGGLQDSGFVSVVPEGSYAAVSVGALIVSDLDGTGRRLLESVPQQPDLPEPAWSPSGNEVAVAPTEVERQLDFVALSGTVSHLNWAAAEPDVPYFPAWSLDGLYVYFTGVPVGDNRPTGTYRIRRDGSGLETLVHCLCYRPSISPDGQFMTFHEVGNEVTVRVWDLATRAYVGPGVPGRFPEWSPAAAEIAFYENNTGRVVLMNQDGTGQRYLTQPELLHQGFSQLSWSSNGQWLIARLISRLFLIEVRTGLILPLPGTEQLFQPALKP